MFNTAKEIGTSSCIKSPLGAEGWIEQPKKQDKRLGGGVGQNLKNGVWMTNIRGSV